MNRDWKNLVSIGSIGMAAIGFFSGVFFILYLYFVLNLPIGG